MKASQQLLGTVRPDRHYILPPRPGYPHDEVEGVRWRRQAKERRKVNGAVPFALPRLTMGRATATPSPIKRNAPD